MDLVGERGHHMEKPGGFDESHSIVGDEQHLRMKTVELGRKIAQLFSIFTFKYEYGNENGKAEHEHELEHTESRTRTNSSEIMSNTVGTRN